MGDEEKSVEAQRDNSISKHSWVEITNDGTSLNRNISVYKQDCDGNVYLKSDDVNVKINDGSHLKEVELNPPLSKIGEFLVKNEGYTSPFSHDPRTWT